MSDIFSPDAPVFIVGGGASLRGSDWSRLHGWPCVAVNTAFRAVPHADVFFFGDDRFFAWHKDSGGEHFWRYKGQHLLTTAVSFKDGLALPDGRRIEWIDPKGLSLGRGKRGVSTALMNSGAKAIALAHRLGARRVVLLGFDNRPGHWHDGTLHAHRIQADPSAYATYAADMAALAKAAQAVGLTIENATPGSALSCFPAVALDDLIP